MTKDQRTIKQQAVQIAGLTTEASALRADLENVRKYKERNDNELNDIHATFDLLGVPRRVENNYYALSANARLTLFLAQANGIKVEQPKDGN